MKPSVALLAEAGPEWVVGRIYICNLVRALNLLPDEERIPFSLAVPYTFRQSDLADLGADNSAARYFAFHVSDSSGNKLRAAKRSVSHGRWPRSLETVLAQAKAVAVFPILESLGKEFPVPWIGWIPDFQHKRLPRFFPDDELIRRDKSFQKLADDSHHVVVSSEDAHAHLLRWFRVSPARVSVFPFVSVSADQWYEEEPGKIATQFELPEKFLIFPSQFWIHKNHRVLFEAIRILRDKGLADICLVSTGYTHDWRHPDHFASLQKLLDQHNLRPHVRILGVLPRATQIQLFRRAVAVVQPSLFEGWSALVEDARTFGKRLYVSDIPIHREEQPANATFFNPDRPDELAGLVARDWPELRPGPDLTAEREAHSEMQRRALVFARLFLQILQRTTATEKGKV